MRKSAFPYWILMIKILMESTKNIRCQHDVGK